MWPIAISCCLFGSSRHSSTHIHIHGLVHSSHRVHECGFFLNNVVTTMPPPGVLPLNVKMATKRCSSTEASDMHRCNWLPQDWTPTRRTNYLMQTLSFIKVLHIITYALDFVYTSYITVINTVLQFHTHPCREQNDDRRPLGCDRRALFASSCEFL